MDRYDSARLTVVPISSFLRTRIISGYLAFLGRLTAEKGPLDAIRIAQACEMPLRIAAKISRAETAFCTPLSLRLRHGEKLSCLPGWNGS